MSGGRGDGQCWSDWGGLCAGQTVWRTVLVRLWRAVCWSDSGTDCVLVRLWGGLCAGQTVVVVLRDGQFECVEVRGHSADSGLDVSAIIIVFCDK